ncbi:MAG: hypothetical protein H7124_05840 [Phycisphaerales bacterium]|nr:hypothetical protein [Hyphomonadaceae bacterium]
MSDLNAQILEQPQDVSLNLSYARAAEAAGQTRLALVAYERILINDPSNAEARRGYERIRRAIEPGYTVMRVEAGARWDSNPRNLDAAEEEAVTGFARATLVDERRLGGARWRSVVDAELEQTPDIDELNYAYLGAQTGPMHYIGPHTAALPAIGGAVASLDDELYFTEVNLGVSFEGRGDGFSYWWRVRGGWRDFGEDFTADEGPYAELIGGVTAPQLLTDRDTLVVVPWVRWSDVEGSAFDFFDEYAPGQYVEYGLDAEYKFRLSDHVTIAAGARARQREFDQTSVGSDTRSDTYVAPNASVTLQNMLPCACDVRARYQHRINDSNDSAAEYEADQVSLSLISRF